MEHSPSTRPPRSLLVSAGQIDHHVRDMTVTAAGDVRLASLQAELAKNNQWLPIDGSGGLHLSQLVEQNSTGPLRLGYGAWRDLLLGVQFENGRGELITAGGRTMKNVAGYDLTKFMVGQRGVFGRIVSITTRTYRRPAGAILAHFAPGKSVSQKVEKLGELLTTPLRPQWSLVNDILLMCGYLGDEATLDFVEARLPQYGAEELHRQTLEDNEAFRGMMLAASREAADHSEIRVSVPPSKIGEFLTIVPLAEWTADPAFGIMWTGGEALWDEACRGAKSVGGSAVMFTEYGTAFQFHADPVTKSVLEKLKAAFDPQQRLARLP